MDNHLDIRKSGEDRNLPTIYNRLEYQPEKEVHLRDYLKIIMKRKWIVSIFLASVFICTTVFTFMMTPMYKSTAVIRINQDGGSDPMLVAGLKIDRGDTTYFSTQYEILRSAALAERVIKKLELNKRKDFLPAQNVMDKITSAITYPFNYAVSFISDAFNKPETAEPKISGNTAEATPVPMYLINALTGRMTVTPVKNSQLVEVSFMSDKPAVSTDVANAIVNTYIEYDLGSRIEATNQAKEFLTNQIALVKEKLEASEQKLNRYASDKEIIYLDSDKQSIMTQKLSEITAGLSVASNDRMQKEALIKEITESGSDNPAILSTSVIQALKQQVAILEGEYANLSKTFKPDYPKMQNLQSQIDSIRKKIDHEKATIVKSLNSDFNASLKRESYFKKAFQAQQKQVLDFQNKASEYQALKSEVVTNTQLHNNLLQKLNEVGVAVMSKASSIQVVDKARFPEGPFKPNKMQNLMMALVFGLIGGVGLAFLVEYFDNTVKDSHDLEHHINLPTLGMIPLQKDFVPSREMVGVKETTPFTEAFRSISTLIMLSSSARPPKSILVCSPSEGEGKTTVAINTAMALTEMLGNGIIIDADLRRPKLHSHFGMENSQGLSTYLSGNTAFDGIDGNLIRPTSVKGLSIMTSGPIPPNPSELVLSSMMRDLVGFLQPLFNFVIIDSVPVMGMPESIYLSKIVDGSIIVARGGQTVNAALLETKRIFSSIDAKILGVVLNGTNEKDLKYGYYSYYNSYFKKQ